MPAIPRSTKAQYLAHEKLDANEHARLFGKIGLAFPLNEYRNVEARGPAPRATPPPNRSHNWPDLEQLIPDMIAAGLMGYTFVCPDLIGGGEFTSFLNQATIDQDLIVRSAQVHALAPMMQFSVAPWRVLDAGHLAAIEQAVALRMRFTPRILELAQASAATGEPILRPLAYVFPDGGYENVKDEFLMGDDLLVAPMVTKGTARSVQIPPGKWKADDGTLIPAPSKRPSMSPSGDCFTSNDSDAMNRLTNITLAVLLLAPLARIHAATYHVDSVAGNDSNSGGSPCQAWRSLDKSQRHRVSARRQAVAEGGLDLDRTIASKGSGTAAKPIVVRPLR